MQKYLHDTQVHNSLGGGHVQRGAASDCGRLTSKFLMTRAAHTGNLCRGFN